MEDSYYDVACPGGFVGIDKLSKHTGTSKKKVKNFLNKQEVYGLHRQAPRKFPRRPVIVSGPYKQYQCDLMQLDKLARFNNGIHFILLVIDVFSKMVYLEPCRRKTGILVTKAFQKIFLRAPKCEKLQADNGSEFYNRDFKNYLQKENIKLFSTHSDFKAQIAERAIRTIKGRLFRYLTHKNTYKYVNALPSIERAYNNSYHSSIKMKPSEVNNDNADQVFNNLYAKKLKGGKPRFKIGDYVRLSHVRTAFSKGYEEQYSREIFKIQKVRHGYPITYALEDLKEEPVLGLFYEEEMQLVQNLDDIEYKIEKVIKRRGKGRNKEVFVKFLGWPEKFNQWMKVSDLKRT